MTDGLCTENWFQVFYSETPLLSLGVFSSLCRATNCATSRRMLLNSQTRKSAVAVAAIYMSASSSRELVNAPLVLSANASLNLPIY